jgi:hypothetical protein|tara:strand:- start:214 stop:1026 length:813 start_codon:yes stop_codon:yes gene_type:complete
LSINKDLLVTSVFKPILREYFKNPTNLTCAEIGVQYGNLSNSIVEHLNPSLFYLIDPWGEDNQKFKSLMSKSYDNDSEMYKAYITTKNQPWVKDNPRIKILNSKSINAFKHIPDNSLDWIYIDGDHTYEGVMTDLEGYLPKMKPNSLIFGDDLTWNKKYHKNEKLVGSEYGDCSIVKALHKFQQNHLNIIESLELSPDLFNPEKTLMSEWEKGRPITNVRILNNAEGETKTWRLKDQITLTKNILNKLTYVLNKHIGISQDIWLFKIKKN